MPKGVYIRTQKKEKNKRRCLDDFIPLCVSCHKLYDLGKIEIKTLQGERETSNFQ